MKRILIIEDDPAILEGLIASMQQEHYEILSAMDGEKGYQIALKENIDVIILDLMLPNKNGQEICRDLRNKGVNTPIIMLTSKSSESDKVLGLELGADDYVTKPFSIRELQARVSAVLRRQPAIKKDIEEYSFDDVQIDFKRQTATKNASPIKLSSREFGMLKYFIQHEGEVITRDMLLDDVWGYEEFPTTRTIDNYILSIRKKIEINPAEPKHLITVHTSGYKFVK